MGRSSWRLFVSEDRSQALLSFQNEPEVALSVGGGEESDGKREGQMGGPRLSPKPQHRPRGRVQLVIRGAGPRDALGLRVVSIVPRSQAWSEGLPAVAQGR